MIKTINARFDCRGYYLRWYFNGWHHYFFKVADEIQQTEGQKYQTQMSTKLVVGDDNIRKNQMLAFTGLMRSKHIFMLTEDGWKACTIVDTDLPYGRADHPGARVEFTLNVWAKKGLFTPLLEVNVTPAPDICVTPVAETCNTSDHPRWEEDTVNGNYGTNAFNFRALPGGRRADTGTFFSVGFECSWWSSTEIDVTYAWERKMLYNNGQLLRQGFFSKKFGLSVRLVREPFSNELACADGGVIERAYVDNAGNQYEGVKIGNQVWLRTNLIDTFYSDNTAIPTGLDNATWEADTTGAMAVYPHALIAGLSSEAEVIAAYGRLYNWYAVDNAKGLVNSASPWRVPTDADFTTLTDYIIALGVYIDITVGNALKSCRQVNSPI